MNKKVEKKTRKHRCLRCGKCCIRTNGTLSMISIHDIAIWISERRYDILEWVQPVIVPGEKVVAFDAWIDPETNDDVSECPWLKKRNNGKEYDCTIDDVKPEMCRNFPFNIDHGKGLGCPVCQDDSLHKTDRANKVSKARCK